MDKNQALDPYEQSLLNPAGDPTQQIINANPLPPSEPLPMEQSESLMPGITAGKALDPTLGGSLPGQMAPAAAPVQPTQMLEPQPTQAPAQSTGVMAPYNAVAAIPGVLEQTQALQNTAKIQAEQGRAEQKIYETGIDLQARAMKAHEQDRQKLVSEIDNLSADIKAHPIDPNHYMENRSTGSKIATAIGMLLGGIGGGLTDQENPAMKFINNQIDRDLKAQEANIHAKGNLLGALERQLGSKDAAAQMFMGMRRQQVADQIMAAGAAAKGPLATEAAKGAIGQLVEGKLQNVLQTQQLIALIKGEQGGADNDPELLVPHMVPKEKQKEVFEAIAKAKIARKVEGEVMQHFNTANKENTVIGRAGRLGFEPPSVSAMQALLMPLIRDSAGRVTEQEQALVANFTPRPGDSTNTVKQKQQAMLQFIRAKEDENNVITKAYRIDLDKFRSTQANPNPTSQYPKAYIDWAQANPQDPRAAKILNSLKRK